MRKKLSRKFYLQLALKVARALLGKHIVHQVGGRKIIGKIVETEAYIEPADRASHARGGKVTNRNLAEYMIGGHIYIYLVYGMYWQLNISTGSAGRPECVLIRSVEPIALSKLKIQNPKSKITNQNSKLFNIANGPGKLCRYLKLDKRHYGLDLTTSREVWLEKGAEIAPSKIIASRRVGIDYAGRYWARKRWRFYLRDNPFVSIL